MTAGLIARLKAPLQQEADFSGVLSRSWATSPARELAGRPVQLQGEGTVLLGDLFDIEGKPEGKLRLVGDLMKARRVAAGLMEGQVVVEGDAGSEAGLALAGGRLEITGDAGHRVGAAPAGYKRGMTGGELIVHGRAGAEAGAAMRRGLLVIGGTAGPRAGISMIAGTVLVIGPAGAEPGLWSKRGSVVALGRVTPPATYIYSCTYQPVHLRLLLTWLQGRYQLPIRRRHITGSYRRFSGDMAELGKGEILQWTAR